LGGNQNDVRSNEFNGSINVGIKITAVGSWGLYNRIEGNQFDGTTTAVEIDSGCNNTVLMGNTPSTFTVTDATTTTARFNADGILKSKELFVREGSNAKMGTATLVAGTVTVSTTAVTANSRIFLTAQTSGAAAGALRVSARTAGTSFTITSTSGTDTSSVAWMLVEPT
jgi:hypothetical protein